MRQDPGAGIFLSGEKGATEGKASVQRRRTTRAVTPGVHLEVASAAKPGERAEARERRGARRARRLNEPTPVARSSRSGAGR